MKSENEKKQAQLEREYAELMRGYVPSRSGGQTTNSPATWNHGTFKQYSLYDESTGSISSTNTLLTSSLT